MQSYLTIRYDGIEMLFAKIIFSKIAKIKKSVPLQKICRF
jgi:hypothetical protein